MKDRRKKGLVPSTEPWGKVGKESVRPVIDHGLGQPEDGMSGSEDVMTFDV